MKIVIIFLFVITMNVSCKKLFEPYNPYPSATQTGQNTLGCYVNGKKWVANGTHDLFVSIPAITAYLYRNFQNKYVFALSARSDPSVFNAEEDAYDDIYFDILEPVLGKMIINYPCNGCGNCDYSSLKLKISGLSNSKCFTTNGTHAGEVFFTKIDTITKIVSGTFEFKAVDKPSGSIIIVMNGRFDVKVR